MDEAQAVLGLARAEAGPGELDDLLVPVMRDLWVLMAELATLPENRTKLTQGATVEQCKGLEVQSVVIESGTRNGQSYRLESLETFSLELRDGVWHATAASTSQR